VAALEVGDTLQHIRGRLPGEVTLVNPRHPLVGERVVAERVHRWRGELWLVFAHPDGALARVRVAETDLMEVAPADAVEYRVVLSFVGVRRLRELLVPARWEAVSGSASEESRRARVQQRSAAEVASARLPRS